MQSRDFLTHVNGDEIKYNARVRFLPDSEGVYQPYEILCFDKRTFCPPGWEACTREKRPRAVAEAREDELFDALEYGEFSRKEARRKAFSRARNRLFDLSMCTMSFDCFVTLTLDSTRIDRYDYDVIIGKLSQWLGNRVRRNGLTYVLVPEYHKDRAIHFHGLCNFEALKTVRSTNAKTGAPLFDDEGRPIYNIADFRLGFTSVIPLSGDNARQATAKYCYKYITKSGGEMVGGRYYLSGGDLGRPRYKYVNIDYDRVSAEEIRVGEVVKLKKYRLSDGEVLVDTLSAFGSEEGSREPDR